MLRRHLLSLAAAPAVAASGAARARAATPERVRVSLIPINEVTPFHAALRQGYFAAEGLEMDLTPSVGAAAGIPGLVAGSFDIAYGNVVSTLLAAQQGLDIKVVTPGVDMPAVETDTSPIVTRSDAGIRSARDLEGRVVGVNTRNNILWLYARAWIAASGASPERVTFREVAFPQMEDALRQKQIDAAFVVVPYASVMAAKPEIKVFGHPYTELQPGLDIGHYVAAGRLFRERPEVAANFALGLRRGIAWYNEHLGTPELVQVIADFTRMDPAMMQAMRLNPAPFTVHPAQIERTMGLMIESKLLRAKLDIAPLIAQEALQP
jgi:NitT/TauT family transport system substrate-binding protein